MTIKWQDYGANLGEYLGESTKLPDEHAHTYKTERVLEDPWLKLLPPKEWVPSDAKVHAEYPLPGSTILDGKPIYAHEVLESQWLRIFRLEDKQTFLSGGMGFVIAYPGPMQLGHWSLHEEVTLGPSQVKDAKFLHNHIKQIVATTVAVVAKRYLELTIHRPLARCCNCTREAVWRHEPLDCEVTRFCHQCWQKAKGEPYKKFVPAGLPSDVAAWEQQQTWYVPENTSLVVIPEAKLSMWCGVYNKMQQGRQLGLLEGLK